MRITRKKGRVYHDSEPRRENLKDKTSLGIKGFLKMLESFPQKIGKMGNPIKISTQKGSVFQNRSTLAKVYQGFDGWQKLGKLGD